MKLNKNDYYEVFYSLRLMESSEVKFLLGIKSDTTLIKMEREGIIKIAKRIGNKKRYCPKHIMKLMGN